MTAPDRPIPVDVLLIGGGVAGLWALDALTSRGLRCALAECGDLGAGQTVASQGIVHGGLKYTLAGLLTGSAANIREMPGVWRRGLAGTPDPLGVPGGGVHPDLSGVPVRSECCYLWRSESLGGRLGMIGARAGLRVAPEALAKTEIPPVLRGVRGPVCRLGEQVLSPAGLMEAFRRRNLPRLLKIARGGVEFTTDRGAVTTATLTGPAGRTVVLAPRHVALTAGAGNAKLLEELEIAGLPDPPAAQRRPLHMTLVRGASLPPLSGHCVDGAKTRVTVTSDVDSSGRVVWQVGGQLAEDGVKLSAAELVTAAGHELAAAIPGLDLFGCDWATYRVDRAEGDAGGARPDDAQIETVGNVHACWPTKLALAPALASRLAAAVGPAVAVGGAELPPDWPRPAVAAPPWETAQWRERFEPLRRAA